MNNVFMNEKGNYRILAEGKYINNNKIISGATILGDGEVALILDVNTLM